ncbi:uncharacterized protein LOC117167296 [Belonocnema kinseyi]|uniref:uncharacterized protein LOC117167296 n=1 Tax=Belonocnema kinseyi TaxID=2817044 RepID=UPI00143CE93C|nr:uncharacterized protein LOC117167296 [Belonocnema kinseyi]
MTSNLVGFTIITFATVTWSSPTFDSQFDKIRIESNSNNINRFKPLLHRRHNDELYAEDNEIQPRHVLGNEKFLSRRFIGEPDTELNSINQPRETSLFKKMEYMLMLLKGVLLQGYRFAKSLSEEILIKDTEKVKDNGDTKNNKKTYLNEISTEE